MASGDLDGGGAPDLAVANWGQSSNDVTVHRNNGDGTFAPATHPTAGERPSAVAVAQLDGAATEDIVAANYESGDVTVFLSDDGGGFLPAVTYALGLPEPRSVAVADVDAALGPDIVVGGGGVMLLRNLGAGAFAGPQPISAVEGHHVVLGDLDGVSGPDVIATDRLTGSMSVWLNEGGGTFSSFTSYPVGAGAYRPAIVDVDGVSGPDILVPTFGEHGVTVFLNDGSGTFHSAVRYNAGGPQPWSVLGADLDGDGDGDAVVSTTDGLSILGNRCLSAAVAVADPGGRTTLSVPALHATTPFTGSTSFRYALPAAGEASLVVFDVRGRRLRQLVRGLVPAGEHRIDWDGRGADGAQVAAGVYFARLDAGGLARTLRVVRGR